MVQYTEWRSISDGSIISSIPDIEDFEDGNVDDWTDINGGSISITETNVYEGTFAGEISGDGNYHTGAYWTPTEDNLHNDLNTLTGYFYEDQGDSLVGLAFYDTQTGDAYSLYMASGFETFTIRKIIDDESTTIDSNTISTSAEQFWKITMTLDTSTGDITGELVRDSDGQTIETASATDADISPNAVGVMTFRNSPTVDNITLD